MRFAYIACSPDPRPETVAFGYRARVLCFMRRFVNGGRRPRHNNSSARILVPGSINARSDFFGGTEEAN
jgi:hypothetical protein